MTKIILYITLVFCCCDCTAQINPFLNFSFKSYTTQQGLADNVVVKTIKDKYGFLWIATHNGISRFDGLHFKNYTHNPADSNSLRSIWVTDLLIDNTQTLWASTEWGVCYYDAINDHFTYINKKEELQVLYKAPMCMGKDGYIWIALEDGLKKINTLTKTFTNTKLTRIPDPKFIIDDNKGSLFIGTRAGGVIKYNTASYNYYRLNLNKMPAGTQYLDALIDDGKMWIATDVGLLLLKEDETYTLINKGIEAVARKNVTQLVCIKKFEAALGKNKIVCGTYDKKLFLFDKIKMAFVYQWQASVANPDGFPAALVYNLFDDNKMLWISTDRGLCQINLDNQQSKTYQIKEILGDDNIALVKKVVATNNKSVVCAIPWQPYNGIVWYDIAKQKIIQQYNIGTFKNGYKYFDIIKAKTNNIIAARDFAVDIFSDKGQLIKTIAVENRPLSIYESEDGNLWLGTENGIEYIDVKKNKTYAYYPNFIGTDVEKNSFSGSFPIYGITKNIDNVLWLASIKYGLFSFDIKTKKFEPHRQLFNTSYSTLNRCSSLQITASDTVWVGNMAGLSCYIISQNKFINYDVSNGLKSAYVYAMVKDSANNLWCRGNADVFYFNTKTHSITSYEMPPNQNLFFYEQRLSIADNKVLVGHEGGFTQYENNNLILKNIEIPNIQITSFKINNVYKPFNNNITNLEPIILSNKQNQITFDYTAIAYNNANDIEYDYYLDGLEKNWINATNKTTINYNNLSPNKYVFYVRAINKMSNVKSKTACFYFIIKPAIYQRWWFWPLLALILLYQLYIMPVGEYHLLIQEKNKKQL